MKTSNEYKETKLGVLPEEWEVKKLELLVHKIVGGGTPSRDKSEYFGGNIPWATVKDLSEENYKDKTIEYISIAGLNNSSSKIIEKNNFIISTRMGLGRGFINTEDMAINQDLKGIYPKTEILNVVYLMYWYKYNGLLFESLGSGSTVKGIDLKTLKNLQIPLPPLTEQQKIAEILSTWDNSIENLENLISKKIETKKGLMQNLLTGKVRFPGFENEWKEVKLGDILNEFSEKTHENNQHMILSVTKTGIIPQSEQFNKQVASSDNAGYKILRYGNLVFSSMNLWMGSLDILRTYEIGIVSPAYKTFKINYSLVDIDFIQDFLKSKHMIWIYNINSEQGASIVRRNLDLDGLLSTKIMLPELREQQKIGKMLSTQDKEIDLLKQKLELVKTQKKGLMQNLLTGKIRVKTS
ncbi:type I restriction-modification system S subunit [Methanococcus maripaludis KA1]|jgi:type I restriction enzyme S subunit|uniref:Type I restriction-modification system S subunit n=1 Tax=Methanococcus maripaludis KA1 TaxID=637914 RepID=A0A2Z5PD74_METMI|nr:restriction endonuclease subunit S [Methanococcus maripaludis]BAP60929.1 type I restriction-modification system S subunit [Methanococcus maripaludis KA1]